MKKTALLLLIFFSVHAGPQGVAASETHIFAAAACPPWKAIPNQPKVTANMANACKIDVDMMVGSFTNLFDVKQSNIITLVNEQATYQGVESGITELAKRVNADDRVILYINMHGGKLDALYEGYPVEDEVFAWYTVKKPTDTTAATKDKWMTVKAFRDLVNTIMADEIVVVIEACHSGGGLHDFQDNYGGGLGHRGKDWSGREAIIFSAHEDQVANFTADGTRALFSSKFAAALDSDSFQTLGDAYRNARFGTHNAILKQCEKSGTHTELIENFASFKEMCTQMPTSWDPFGLLEDIQLQKSAFSSPTEQKAK